MGYTKKGKFSYSKLNTFESCGWKYKLIYHDGHYIFTDSLASELGTTLHFIEEQIAGNLKSRVPPDYPKLINDFLNINIPKTSPMDMDGGIYGINLLKNKYALEFFKPDEQGSSYDSRTLGYIDRGIYRLENYLKANPGLEVYSMEQFFSVDYHGHVLSGYIDRILYDKNRDMYIVEDIKTKNKPFKDTELTTPLQFVVYVYALSNMLDIPYDQIECAYDLPFLDIRQPAGTLGFMKRGLKKLDEIFDSIEGGDFTPQPSPLCHWCAFCPTNPDQPEDGKFLCPYYSKWTREHKTFEVSHKWTGLSGYADAIADERRMGSTTAAVSLNINNDFDF